MQPSVITNFITKETSEYINNYLRPKSTINPKGVLNVSLNSLNLNSSMDLESKIVHDLINLSIDSISNQFGFPKDSIKLDRVMYQVLQKGDSLGWHTDAYGGVDGYTDAYYSALLYLTDDYEGGEIWFYDDDSGDPANGTAYKPSKGTLIHFKGDKDHPHEVKEVVSGERANLILFYAVNQ